MIHWWLLSGTDHFGCDGCWLQWTTSFSLMDCALSFDVHFQSESNWLMIRCWPVAMWCKPPQADETKRELVTECAHQSNCSSKVVFTVGLYEKFELKTDWVNGWRDLNELWDLLRKRLRKLLRKLFENYCRNGCEVGVSSVETVFRSVVRLVAKLIWKMHFSDVLSDWVVYANDWRFGWFDFCSGELMTSFEWFVDRVE